VTGKWITLLDLIPGAYRLTQVETDEIMLAQELIASGRVIEAVSGHHEQALACEGSSQVGVPTGRKPSAKG
jgi:hypothetical protein